MKFYMLKTIWVPVVMLLTITGLQAQFDDVYYDPDVYVPVGGNAYQESIPPASQQEEGVQYYDDDEYGYYEDDGYYYTNRIQRFYHPYIGFDFYAPVYAGFYYDPWDYYYPASGFSFSIGFGFGWGSWYGGYYPYYGYPSYYGYYPPYYGYGGYGCGYYPTYGCGGGYYYGGCGNNWGHYDNHWDHHDDHYGGHGDYYYGPRVAGNTGSSPRNPPVNPGIGSPTVKEHDADVAVGNDKPRGLPEPGTPGRVTPSGNPVTSGTEHSPATPPSTREEAGKGVVTQTPVDRELPRDQYQPPKNQRPVFKPDAQKYQPYPTSQRSTPPSGSAPSGNAGNQPGAGQERPGAPTSGYTPYPHTQRQEQTQAKGTQTPGMSPSDRATQDRPRYTPPPRSNQETRPSSGSSGQGNTPSYRPSGSSNESNHNERSGYTPSSRSDSPRSSDRPSYSPPSHSSPSSGNSGGGYRSSGGSSSGGGSRSGGGSSGSGHTGGSSSPRGKG